MKKMILLIFLLLPLSAFAQQRDTLSTRTISLVVAGIATLVTSA